MTPAIEQSAISERNDARSTAEVATFTTDAPDRYFAYQSHDVTIGHLRQGDLISTWMGDKLATVIGVGAPFQSNFGDTRQPFTARAVNGAIYYGTAYLSAGDYVHMFKAIS